nr:MAK10-like protein [Tanacetum cinerariifolium]
MGGENPIRTLGDYSKPSHEGYRNTIELLVGNNVVLLRSDTIRLVKNGCLFHEIRSEDPNQHLKDFLKLVDSLDLDGENRERTDFTKLVKAIALPQDVPSISDRLLIELENQVQRLIEAHLTPTQPTQVNKITTSCEICSGPHDTQYCMEDPEQAFIEYASSRTDEAGDARLTKFEADFKQQQSKMTNKIDTVLKVITDRITRAVPNDTVKNPKLSTSPVLSARSYPNMDPQCSNHIQGSINGVTIHSKKQSDSYDEKAKENEEKEKDGPENIHVNPSTPPDPSVAFITKKVLKFNSFFELLELVPQSSDNEVICTKGDDGEVMFIELIRKNDDSSEGEPKGEGNTTTKGVGAGYFDIFPTRSELAYHKDIMCSPIPSIFLRNPIITEGCPSNLKIPCNIGHVHVKKAYIDPNSPLNIMTRMMYN